MKWAVVAPPGSRWQLDLATVLGDLLEHEVVLASQPEALRSVEALVVCGDEGWRRQLRLEAGTAQTLGRALCEYANEGGLLLAIGEGFGAVCDMGLLPGTVEANQPAGFISRMVALEVRSVSNPWAQRAAVGDRWWMPLRSSSARFVADEAEVERLEHDGRILLQYIDDAVGSTHGIAAVMNAGRNVLGMSVHPENVVDAVLTTPHFPGVESGRILFDSVGDWYDDGAYRGRGDSQR